MRLRAIAFALPFVVGIACSTSKAAGERTASVPPTGGQPSADAQTRGAAGPTRERDTSAATAAEAQETEAGSTASVPPTGGQPSADAQSRGAAGPTRERDTSAATAAEADRTGTSGEMGAMGDVKAHASDEVVSGKITKVSSDEVTIAADDGSDRTLRIVPETTVRVDGETAQGSDLQEGQPVRASFSEVNGRDVAVEIRAGEGSSGSMMHDPGSMHESGSMGSEHGTMPESGSSTERKY